MTRPVELTETLRVRMMRLTLSCGDKLDRFFNVTKLWIQPIPRKITPTNNKSSQNENLDSQFDTDFCGVGGTSSTYFEVSCECVVHGTECAIQSEH